MLSLNYISLAHSARRITHASPKIIIIHNCSGNTLTTCSFIHLLIFWWQFCIFLYPFLNSHSKCPSEACIIISNPSIHVAYPLYYARPLCNALNAILQIILCAGSKNTLFVLMLIERILSECDQVAFVTSLPKFPNSNPRSNAHFANLEQSIEYSALLYSNAFMQQPRKLKFAFNKAGRGASTPISPDDQWSNTADGARYKVNHNLPTNYAML